MEQLATVFVYLRAHPAVAVAAAIALVGVRYVLNRKSRLSREADQRLAELRRERADYYNKLRPPR
ncbi:MAG: hypothetical protein ACE5I7_01455 [Candidatus Binatia bacterium]